jgi:general secretion pathway protein G
MKRRVERTDRSGRKETGFSLVELMVVVAIMGVLASVVAYNVIAQAKKANREAAKTKLQEIAKGVETFYVTNGFKYPDSIDQLIAGEDPPLKGGNKALQDPWGGQIEYIYDRAGTPPFNLISRGADKAPGGTGDDADIEYRSLEQ